MNVLISGTGGGLGRYLLEQFAADAFDRMNCTAPKENYDLIIHCAFNITENVPASRIAEYVQDTIALTEWLLAISHTRFVYMSSAAVYPEGDATYAEDANFSIKSIGSLYGLMKMICEGIVEARANCPLIVRSAPMLGPYIRKNTLLKILTDATPQVPISANSQINHILHEDVTAFIRAAHAKDLTGTYNLAASTNATLGEIALHFGKAVQFGNVTAHMNRIDNRKAAAFCPALANSTLTNIERFYASITSQLPASSTSVPI